MQGAHQSPAARGSLAATVRRLLVAGLIASVITTSRPATRADGQPLATAHASAAPLIASAADRAHGRAGAPSALRDGGLTDATGEAGAQPEAASPAGLARPADVTGKATGPEDVQQQGSVVAVFQDPVDPLIVIAVDHGYLTVRLRCGDRCPTIHQGDYVVAEGSSRSEAVFDADDVWVVTP